jgi:hypothetical protein
MGLSVTVAIATYGDESWRLLARNRALPSALEQAPAVHAHADTLAEARNRALRSVETEWVIHLDADDELEPGYIDAMAGGSCDLRAPAVRYVRGGRARSAAQVPRVAGHRHACTGECLPQGNWLVIGTCARTRMLLDVGGWRDFEWSEDWDLWLRCHLAGASVEAIPEAVYRAHVRPDSRNRAPSAEFRREAHEAIYRANYPEDAAA